MLWITKYTHNKIVKQYQDAIEDLRQSLWRKDEMVSITERLTKIVEKIDDRGFSGMITSDGGWASASEINVMAHLDDTVPRYVEDYFGGKCIKQESTPVTILDTNGKATYSQTKQAPDKGKTYKLVQL